MSATGCGVCPRWDAPSVYDQNDISESADLALLVNPSEIRIDPPRLLLPQSGTVYLDAKYSA